MGRVFLPGAGNSFGFRLTFGSPPFGIDPSGGDFLVMRCAGVFINPERIAHLYLQWFSGKFSNLKRWNMHQPERRWEEEEVAEL